MMEIVRIPLTDDIRAEAARIAAKIAKTATMKRDNPTGLVAPGRYENGALGELATRAWFDEQHVRYRYNPRTDGKSDRGDFDVWVRGQGKKLDVKTAARGTQTHCMMPEYQFSGRKSKRYDYYLAARLVDDSPDCDLMRWAPLRDVFRWKVVPRHMGDRDVITRLCPYVEMEPINELLQELDRR